MTGIVVVTHGPSGTAMVESAERVVGRLEKVVAVTVTAGESGDAMKPRITDAFEKVRGDGVVFLVDLGGSTPANLCRRIGAHHDGTLDNIVVTGINLPMLFKLATIDRSVPPVRIAEELASTGTKSIHVWGTDAGS